MKKEPISEAFSMEAINFGEENNKAIVGQLSEEEKVRWHTETDDSEIMRVSSAKAFALVLKHYDINIDNIVEAVLETKFILRVSNRRQGRKEFIEAFKAEQQQEMIRQSGFLVK